MSDLSVHQPVPAQAEQATGWPSPWLLKQSREAAGLHIAALAAALKVPVKKLEALEAGRYDELPDLTFARALASSACRHLRVDPAPVLEQIPTAQAPQLGDSSHTINAPFKGVASASAAHPAGWLSRPAVLGAMALLLGALLLVLLPGKPIESSAVPAGPDTPLPAAPASAPEPAAAAPVVDVPAPPDTGAVPAAAASATWTAGTVTVPLTGSTTLAAPAASTTTATITDPAAPGTASLLRIKAISDSWVEVVNGSGAVVIQRLLKTGDVVDFSTAPPYAVVLGRVEAAEVSVRGQPFDVTPFARNSVARFEVK